MRTGWRCAVGSGWSVFLAVLCLLAALTPAARAETRLVHGPVLLKLTGYERAGRQETIEKRYARYMVLFKVSDDVTARRNTVGNKSVRGNFRVGGVTVGEVAPVRFARPGCIAIVFYAPGPLSFASLAGLQKYDPGDRVKVALHVLTAGPDGRPMLGRRYESRPRMRKADYELHGETARRELKRIGCEGPPGPT